MYDTQCTDIGKIAEALKIEHLKITDISSHAGKGKITEMEICIKVTKEQLEAIYGIENKKSKT